MKRLKTFFIYALCIILFFIFSDVMINVALETTYKNIERKDKIEQVTISQAQATRVNGRIKGSVTNNNLQAKYLRFDFYSERNVIMGTKYIDISALSENETQNIEMHFKLQNVNYYNISTANEKDNSVTEINLLPKDMSKADIFWGTFLVFILMH